MLSFFNSLRTGIIEWYSQLCLTSWLVLPSLLPIVFDLCLVAQGVRDPSLNLKNKQPFPALSHQLRKMFWNADIGTGDVGVTVLNWNAHKVEFIKKVQFKFLLKLRNRFISLIHNLVVNVNLDLHSVVLIEITVNHVEWKNGSCSFYWDMFLWRSWAKASYLTNKFTSTTKNGKNS